MISIIVPVYNTEKYLDRCIQSILAQTYTDFELLLINDGSTDSSGVICDKYAEQDSRVRVFHKENGGASSARNLGLDNARGEWIGWVDSDDWINAGMYEQLYAAATFKCANIAYCNNDGKMAIEMPAESLSLPDFLNKYISCPLTSLCLTLAKKQIYTDNDLQFGIGQNLGEDLMVTTKLYYYAGTRAYVPQELYHYQEIPNSITNSKTEKSSGALLNNTLELYKFFSRTPIFYDVKESLAFRILSAKQIYLYQHKNISKWYSISPWTHKYIIKNYYNGIKGKFIEWSIVRLYRLCLKLSMVKL